MGSVEAVTKLSPGVGRHIEAELYAYPLTKAHIEQRRLAVIEGGMGISVKDQSHSREGSGWWDPTGLRGSLLADDIHLREMARVVDAIDSVLARIPESWRRLVELWYWQRLGVDRVANRCHVSRETAYRQRRMIIVAIALQLGWGS